MTKPPLRIHIITEEDPFYLPEFFRQFFAHLPRQRFEVTGVDITPPLNQSTPLGLARRLYNFYGPLDFTRLGFRYALRRAMDILLPRAIWNGTIPRLCRQHGLRSRSIPDVNAPDYVNGLRTCHPDLLISVAASQVLKKEILSVPRIASINIHTGTLPRYRGMLPVFWQMYDSQESIGITIHTMTENLDLGETVFHRLIPLESENNLDRVIRKMKRKGAMAMIEVLELYYNDGITPIQMDRSGSSYHSFPGREEASRFRKMGNRLL